LIVVRCWFVVRCSLLVVVVLRVANGPLPTTSNEQRTTNNHQLTTIN
jgi:hypothetical protein